MAPKSKSRDVERSAEALLRPGPVRAVELVEAIHLVNPTGLGLPPDLERSRYALKSRLQSRLILDFFSELDFVQVPDEPGVITVWYRPQTRDACHAVVAELEVDARSKVQFRLDTQEAGVTSRAAPFRPARSSIRAEGDERDHAL